VNQCIPKKKWTMERGRQRLNGSESTECRLCSVRSGQKDEVARTANIPRMIHGQINRSQGMPVSYVPKPLIRY
jgi:hypothetical protein